MQTSVLQELSAQSITCIENEKLHSLPLDDIIHKFTFLKPQRKCFKFYMIIEEKE
jgi:hypothetical protein